MVRLSQERDSTYYCALELETTRDLATRYSPLFSHPLCPQWSIVAPFTPEHITDAPNSKSKTKADVQGVDLVELKNGETFNGHLVNCDNWMNLTLREVIQTSSDGDRFWRLTECYIRGNTIKYLRVPDEIIDMVKEDAAKQRAAGGRNNNRGGTGGNNGGEQRGGHYSQQGGDRGGRGGGRGGRGDYNKSGRGGYNGGDRGGRGGGMRGGRGRGSSQA
ncbi:RNA processing protein [Mortierella alpina]|nr:RNA processing protein [Mortierella alpina]